MHVQKKRIDLRLAGNVLNAIDRVCVVQQITRTNFIETACREKLNKLRIKPTGKKEVNWQGDIEDMPGV